MDQRTRLIAGMLGSNSQGERNNAISLIEKATGKSFCDILDRALDTHPQIPRHKGQSVQDRCALLSADSRLQKIGWEAFLFNAPAKQATRTSTPQSGTERRGTTFHFNGTTSTFDVPEGCTVEFTAGGGFRVTMGPAQHSENRQRTEGQAKSSPETTSNANASKSSSGDSKSDDNFFAMITLLVALVFIAVIIMFTVITLNLQPS